MNRLQSWEKEHRQNILAELSEAGIDIRDARDENIRRIIEETSFRVRSRKHPEKCPYYRTNPLKSCYTEIKDLNCFLCACPNYLSERLVGGCRIGSKYGKFTFHKNLPAEKVWDCSDCPVNHTPGEVEAYIRGRISEQGLDLT